MEKHKPIKYIMTGILILYAIAMIIVATLPNIPGYSFAGGTDKIIHFIEFFIFTILILSTFYIDGVENYYVVALIVVLVLAMLSELVQIPVLERTFSIKDMMADFAGVALGYIIFWGVKFEWRLLKRSS